MSIRIRHLTDRSSSNGSETGSDFADFLIGVASNYNQADSQAYYIRHKYAGGFAQDSWRIKSNLTLNYGVRWDLMEYWSEKYNQIPTFLPGHQSTVYPNALPGLVYPSDPGVPIPGALEQSFFTSDRFGVVAGKIGRTSGKDHWRARERRAFVRVTVSSIPSLKAIRWLSTSRSPLWSQLYQSWPSACSPRRS